MTIHQSFSLQHPTWSNRVISKNSTTVSPWPQTNSSKWNYKLKYVQQQSKHTTPKYLSAIDLHLHPLLLPAISTSQIIKNLMKWEREKFRNVAFLIIPFWSSFWLKWKKMFFQKYISSHNAIVKAKCPTRKKVDNRKHAKKVQKKYSWQLYLLWNFSSSSFINCRFLSFFSLFFFLSFQFLKCCFFSVLNVLVFFSQFYFLFTEIIFVYTHFYLFFLNNCSHSFG